MSEYHKVARRHFPLRPIEGDGALVLYSECDCTLPIMLFGLEIVRAATLGLWASSGCGADKCRGAHITKQIKLRESPQPVLVARESFCWERD